MILHSAKALKDSPCRKTNTSDVHNSWPNGNGLDVGVIQEVADKSGLVVCDKSSRRPCSQDNRNRMRIGIPVYCNHMTYPKVETLKPCDFIRENKCAKSTGMLSDCPLPSDESQ